MRVGIAMAKLYHRAHLIFHAREEVKASSRIINISVQKFAMIFPAVYGMFSHA
jgi:hypothetical protein